MFSKSNICLKGSPVLDMDENEDMPEENQEELDQDSSDSQQDFGKSFVIF